MAFFGSFSRQLKSCIQRPKDLKFDLIGCGTSIYGPSYMLPLIHAISKPRRLASCQGTKMGCQWLQYFWLFSSCRKRPKQHWSPKKRTKVFVAPSVSVQTFMAPWHPGQTSQLNLPVEVPTFDPNGFTNGFALQFDVLLGPLGPLYLTLLRANARA